MTAGALLLMLAGSASAWHLLSYGSRYNQLISTEDSYNNMKKALKENGLDSVALEDIVDYAFDNNLLTSEQKKKYYNIAKDIGTIDKYYVDQGEQTGILDSMGDQLAQYSQFLSKKYGKTGQEFYDLITQNAESFIRYKTDGKITGESIANAMLSGTPNYTVTAPNYLELPDLPELQDVDPVKRWTGPELAEFHEIPYDIAEYYDALKQGNEAAVDYAKYQNAQANETSMFSDTENHANYLDNIRNTRADAIANGATLGAKYANELLANKEAISNYADAQQDVANQAMSVLESPINANARTMTSTREYFDKLALSIEDVINQLYYNDTVRFGQDWLNNATRYKAGIDEYGGILNANANMYASYVQNKAAADAANAKNKAQADDYAFLFDNVLLPASDYNVNKAMYLFDDVMQRNQTGNTRNQNFIANSKTYNPGKTYIE